MAESPANPQNRRAAEYLRRTLAMNPLYEADALIALRTRALRLKDPAEKAAPDDTAQRRSAALKALEGIRSEVWTAAPQDVLSRLHDLPDEGLPEVQAAARRLRVVAENRPKLPALTGHKDFDGDFFSCLKQVLAASPRDTNVLREKVLASFRSGKLRKRGRRMIKLLRNQAPELFALEQDWLTSLETQKQVAATSGAEAGGADFADESSFNVPFWVWWVLIILTLRVIRTVFSS